MNIGLGSVWLVMTYKKVTARCEKTTMSYVLWSNSISLQIDRRAHGAVKIILH